jgi:RNA recognition motif-containing protein
LELTDERNLVTNIFVRNLNYETTQDELQATFSRFGNVARIKILTDRYTGQALGIAFVEMSDDNEARKAISQLNGTELNGRALNVNEARPKPEGGNRDTRQRSGGRGRRW